MTSEAIPRQVNRAHGVQQRNDGPAGVREARDDGTFLDAQVTVELTLGQTRVECSFVCQLARCWRWCWRCGGWCVDAGEVRGLGRCGNSRDPPGCLVWHARITNGVPGLWRAAGMQPRLSLARTLAEGPRLARPSSGSVDGRDTAACCVLLRTGRAIGLIRWMSRAAGVSLVAGAGQ